MCTGTVAWLWICEACSKRCVGEDYCLPTLIHVGIFTRVGLAARASRLFGFPYKNRVLWYTQTNAATQPWTVRTRRRSSSYPAMETNLNCEFTAVIFVGIISRGAMPAASGKLAKYVNIWRAASRLRGVARGIRGLISRSLLLGPAGHAPLPLTSALPSSFFSHSRPGPTPPRVSPKW